MSTFDNQEKLVDQYLEQDNSDAAVKLLFKLIVLCAKEKNFSKAEEFRKKLIEADSLALNEIIKSAEIIEDAKSESLDQSHMSVFGGLYDSLSTEEGNALFYSMKDITYGVDETIFKQDGMNSNIYFIDHGELKMVYRREGMEHLLKTIGSGDIAGEDTFFSISFCTTSLITINSVKLKVLNRAVLKEWNNDYPLLESKIRDYCDHLESAEDLLKQKGKDRRIHKRVCVSGTVVVQIIDSTGNLTGNPFKGEITDISAGGLSFSIKIAKDQTARLMLGRKLKLKLELEKEESHHAVVQNGVIISVSHSLMSEYAIHVKFEEAMHQKAMMEIAKYSTSE